MRERGFDLQRRSLDDLIRRQIFRKFFVVDPFFDFEGIVLEFFEDNFVSLFFFGIFDEVFPRVRVFLAKLCVRFVKQPVERRRFFGLVGCAWDGFERGVGQVVPLLRFRIFDLPSQGRIQQIAAFDENFEFRALDDGQLFELFSSERGAQLRVEAEIEQLEGRHFLNQVGQIRDRLVGQTAVREDESPKRACRSMQNRAKWQETFFAEKISRQIDDFQRVVVFVEVVFRR